MMDKEMKSERITLRVSPKEKEEIEKKAAQAHLSVSKYLLRLSEFDDPQKFKENVLNHQKMLFLACLLYLFGCIMISCELLPFR